MSTRQMMTVSTSVILDLNDADEVFAVIYSAPIVSKAKAAAPSKPAPKAKAKKVDPDSDEDEDDDDGDAGFS